MPNLFSKKISFSKSGIPAFGQSPEGDWRIIFTVAALVALLGIAVNVFIFIKIDKGEIFVVDNLATEGGNTLDVAELEETVNYYQNKQAVFENLLRSSSTTAVVDPSL
jgi:hypothetical protein